MTKRISLLVLILGMFILAQANPIDRAEARRIAQESVGIDDTSSDEVPISPYYIFSRGAGKGFVIVSGDDATTPIIGYTEQGDFIFDELPEPLQLMLKSWEEKIRKVQASPRRQGPRRTVSERLQTARAGVEGFKATWEDIPVLCQTHWHQSSPYNNLAPVNPDNPSQRAVTGCVATAAAQIIYYFHKDNPSELQYATPTYKDNWGPDYGNYPVTESLPKGTPIEYDLMKLSGHGTTKQDHAVAVLMYAIGTSSRLNYGPSTAGQPDDAGNAIANQFLINNTYVAKWNFNQRMWEQRVYNSLKAGSPMLYSGTHPTSGGHAVVLDGYRASTGTYHFNFGWGGQGDGWYTIDDETGMNGFNSDQRGCLDFKPKKQNLACEVEIPQFYSQSTGYIKATIENNGTLNYAGIDLYVNTSRDAITSTPVRSNTQVIASGDKVEIIFEYKPSAARDAIYFFVTDKEKNILAKGSTSVLPCKPDMTLKGISVDAGTQKQDVDGFTFGMVNNKTATVTATIANSEEGTYCQPRIVCQLWYYKQESGEWKQGNSTYVTTEIFNSGETKPVTFEFMNLLEGTYYKAFLSREVRAGTAFELKHENLDTLVYFTVRAADFEMTVDGRQAVVKGHWNDNLFKKADTDASICSYDMTGVEELTKTPSAANPNAIFYTSYPIEGAQNIVYDGTCNHLVIDAAHEFMAAKEFKANQAIFVLPVDKAAQWDDVLLPFAADIPFGMQVKGITGFGSSALNTENLRHVEAMTPMLYLMSRDGMNQITATDVEIGTETTATAANGNIQATTLIGEAPTQTMLFGFKNEVPYYLPSEGQALAPFKTLMTKYNKNGYRAVAASEVRYPELAAAINDAYQAKAQFSSFATADALSALDNAIAQAEDIFTFVKLEKSSDVRVETNTLREAIQAFLDVIATGIEAIEYTERDTSHTTTTKAVYDLSGRKVANSDMRHLQKGIYIVNGRKMLVK